LIDSINAIIDNRGRIKARKIIDGFQKCCYRINS